MNLHYVVAWMSRKSSAISECVVTTTGLQPTTTYFVKEQVRSNSSLISDIAPVLSKGFPWYSGVCDMIKRNGHLHHTDKYSQHSLISWPVGLNGWGGFLWTKWLWVRVFLQSLKKAVFTFKIIIILIPLSREHLQSKNEVVQLK